jgi:hypothetical protein
MKIILVLLSLPVLAYFIGVKGLLVDLPIEIGRAFETQDRIRFEQNARHNKLAEYLIVRCIHRHGLAMFSSLDEYRGCDPLP